MTYASPELVVVGRAEVLVLGTSLPGMWDSPGSVTRPESGLALGLDD